MAFWEWLIREVRDEHPEVIFLAEAFTRPAMMTTLAKLGFASRTPTSRGRTRRRSSSSTCSSSLEWSQFYRPNAFANTPDILHEYLQHGGPPAFEARLVLAATLSPSYGIYSGYESFENVPVRAGSEEYLDSEKYEVKQRTLDGPLLPLVQRLNAIAPRRARAAAVRQPPLARDGERAPVRLREGTMIVCRRQPRPGSPQEGVVRDPGRARLPPAFGRATCSPASATVARRPQLRRARRRARPTC